MAFGGVVLQLIDKCVLSVKYVFFLQKKITKNNCQKYAIFCLPIVFILCKQSLLMLAISQRQSGATTIMYD